MISFETLNQIKDIMTVLENTKKSLKSKPSTEFSDMVASMSNNPGKQSEVAQVTVKPETKIQGPGSECIYCGKPGKYMINGVWVCEECKNGIRK
jgi:hypothetical protein